MQVVEFRLLFGLQNKVKALNTFKMPLNTSQKHESNRSSVMLIKDLDPHTDQRPPTVTFFFLLKQDIIFPSGHSLNQWKFSILSENKK